MSQVERDDVREERITDEIIVDANGPEEQAMGWYYYLADTLQTPFKARCITVHATSPLQLNEEVNVVEMAPVAVCEHDMFVMIAWEQRTLAVPLVQLQGIGMDEDTKQAIDDWQYWKKRGYHL